MSQIFELADHRPKVEVEIKCEFTDAIEEADEADELNEHDEADDADNKADAANETKANETNDAVKVVKTVEANVCCFDYGCGETFTKQPMSR